GGRAPRRRARRHARARARRAPLPRRDRRARPRGRGRPARHRGPLGARDARRPRRRHRLPGRGARARPGQAGRHAPDQGVPWRRPRGRRRGPSGSRRVMGRVLIAGTAALLICIFLSPKFIEFLRTREFGQNIREEGPEGHHSKAGTPTMGGIIIFTAIAVPFLLLTDYFDWRSWGVFGVAVAGPPLGVADD